MKKILLLIITICMVGCSKISSGYLNKTCTKTNYGDIDTKYTYNISFKENNISQIILKENYYFNDISLKNNLVIGLENLKQTNSIEGLSIKTKDNKDSYEIEYTFDIEKTDEDTLQKYQLKTKYNLFKEYLEKLDYVCN